LVDDSLESHEAVFAPNSNRIEVSIVWGLKPEASWHEVPAADGFASAQEMDPSQMYSHFDMSSPACQLYILGVCKSLSDHFLLYEIQPDIRCWIVEFEEWLKVQAGGTRLLASTLAAQSSANALLKDEWLSKLGDWLATSGARFDSDIAFRRTHDGGPGHIAGVSWFRIGIYSSLLPRYTAGFSALPFFRRIDSLVGDINEGSNVPQCIVDAPAFQTSDQWPRVFTEVTAVNGTVYAIAIIAILATWSILIFTGSIRISMAVMVTCAAILATILALFFCLGWSLGIVEAISISILLGSSVDYSLHIAEAYMEIAHKRAKRERAGGSQDRREQDIVHSVEDRCPICALPVCTCAHTSGASAFPGTDSVDCGSNEDVSDDSSEDGEDSYGRCGRRNGTQATARRQELAMQALKDVGGAVLHAAITTLLSVVALTLCEVRIFEQFGMIIGLSVAISVIFAIVFLPTVLVLIGPEGTATGTCRHYMIALQGTVVVVVVIFCLLLAVDTMCGQKCRVLGPDGRPLFG
jgi:hypothetical protein